MSFNMYPRSRSPVFSISTLREETDSLRAQIEAANTKQKVNKKRNTRTQQVSIRQDTSDSLDSINLNDHVYTIHRKSTIGSWPDSISSQTYTRPTRSISGTIKGEFSNAKHLLKSTSKKQLQRLRTRKTRSTIVETSKFAREKSIPHPSRFAELSSDPPIPQLEDTQKVCTLPVISRKPLPASYHFTEKTPVHTSPDGTQISQTNTLFTKEYSCDSCQQLLTGKDFYDFCQMCGPGDRVICMTCASRGGCWRHRPETLSMLIPPSLCGSPAPSYEPEEYTGEDYKREAETVKTHPRSQSEPHAQIEDLMTVLDQPLTKLTLNDSVRGRRDPDEKPAVLAQMQHDMLAEVRELLRKQDHQSATTKPIGDREVALRDQQAAVREQQIALREDALLLREREHVARERDAIFIRNLQTLALEGLTRGQQIGSQFQPVKTDKLDDIEMPSNAKRSDSTASESSNISLETSSRSHIPRDALINVVAAAEATIGSKHDSDKHIRSRPEKRKKSGGSYIENNSSSVQQPTSASRRTNMAQRGGRHEKESSDDGDDGILPPKKQKKSLVEEELHRRNFACPYCKFDAQRYSSRNLTEMKYRNCSTHFLPNIPRVKQHLQRVHWRPDNHCQRCFEVFDSPGELIEHHTHPVACDRQECPFPEKMDMEQRKQIHVKRPNIPAEALWYDIYKILFPNTPLPESPYADEEPLLTPPSAAPSIANSDEAPQMLQQAFNESLDRHGDKFDQKLRDLLNQVLEESISTVYNKVSMTSTPSSAAPLSRGPSIIVSPVTPFPRKGSSTTAPVSPLTSLIAPRPASGRQITKRSATNSVPQLQKPERQFLAPALDRSVAACATQSSGTGLANSVSSLSHQAASHVDPNSFLRPPAHQDRPEQVGSRPSSDSTQLVDEFSFTNMAPSSYTDLPPPPDQFDASHVLDAGFDWQIPTHVREDKGYDDECLSYEQGDDQYAMEEKIQMRCAENSKNPIYSPVDSGYGSGSSLHPRLRTPTNVEGTQDLVSIEPVARHETFMKDFQEWKARDELQGTPCWPGHIGRAM